MKTNILSIALSTIALMGLALSGQAQEKIVTDSIQRIDTTKNKKEENGYTLSLGSEGIKLQTKKQRDKREKSRFETNWGLMDLGLNFLHDQTIYGASNLMTTKYGVQEDWFDLRNGRSWNVNIYPVMANFKAVRQKNFKMNIYTGIGFQIYNFRYKTSVTHHSDPKDMMTNDVNFKFSKNKLSQNFLTVPFMVNFNHKIDKSNWLTYGFGASVGYNLNTWTKQQSSQYGKVKNHDLYNFNEFNVNLIGEIGIGELRLFGSYQITNMYKNTGLVQHPVSFGIRFGSI